MNAQTASDPATTLEARAREMFPRPADEPLRAAAVAAGTAYLAGDLTPEVVGASLAQARRVEAAARAAARMVGVLAAEAGGKHATVAAAVGVDRMALLKWLGLR